MEEPLAQRTEPRRTGGTTRTVAIDAGFAIIHAVEILHANGDQTVKRGSAVIQPEWWDDLAAHKDQMAQAIKAALSSAGIVTTTAVAGLPRRLVTVKYARLPHAEPEMIRGMVQFEAQQYIPFPLEDVVLDYQIVSDDTDEMTTAMIVAARRSLVENLLLAFDAAGIEVTRLSVSSIGLAEHARSSLSSVALLEIEPDDLDIAVVSDGKLLFSRSAPLPRSPSGQDDIQMLAGEVARSLAAYQNEHRAQAVSTLYVDGPPQTLDDLQASLGRLFEIPVERIYGGLVPASNGLNHQYATATGLGIANNNGAINLIPQARIERKAAARRRIQTAVGVVLAAAALVTAGLFISQSLADQAKDHALALRWNTKLKAAVAAASQVKTKHDTVVKAYQTVIAGLGRDTSTVEILRAISSSIPKAGGIYLTQLSFDRAGTVSVRGNAKTETAATDLVLGLQSSGAFADVRLPYMGDAQAEAISTTSGVAQKAKPGENMSFIITCRLKNIPILPTDKPPTRSAAAGTAGGSNP